MTEAIREELEKARKRHLDIVQDMRRHAIELADSERPLYIFGAGALGRWYYEHICQKKGILGFVDNNPVLHGQTVDGLRVRSLAHCLHRHPDADIIIAVQKLHLRKQILAQCREAGAQATLLRRLPSRNGGITGDFYWDASLEPLMTVSALFDFESELVKCESLFSDAVSRHMFFHAQNRHFDAERYFQTDLLTPRHLRSVVDAGAYTGNTFKSFQAVVGNDFDHYYMIEPMPDYYESIEAFWSADVRIRLFQNIVSDRREQISVSIPSEQAFLDAGNYTAHPASAMQPKHGDRHYAMQKDTLDNLLGDSPVTAIKMDVEGGELEALKGSIKIIKRQKPALIICYYHKLADTWEIPSWIHGLNLGYKLFLRHPHHSVCYAIPG